MDLNIFLAFAVATAIMIALPGPNVILTVAHSISFGWKRALLTVAGATVGIVIQLIIAAIGLISLLNTAAEVFACIRWVGAAYLVYLGIIQWRSSDSSLEFERPPVSPINLFSQGVLVTVPNPKSLIFIAAFLPQFIDATRPVGLQLAVVFPTFLLITFSVTAVWAIAAGSARNILDNRKVSRPMLKTTGGLRILAGLGMVFVRRSN